MRIPLIFWILSLQMLTSAKCFFFSLYFFFSRCPNYACIICTNTRTSYYTTNVYFYEQKYFVSMYFWTKKKSITTTHTHTQIIILKQKLMLRIVDILSSLGWNHKIERYKLKTHSVVYNFINHFHFT